MNNETKNKFTAIYHYGDEVFVIEDDISFEETLRFKIEAASRCKLITNKGDIWAKAVLASQSANAQYFNSSEAKIEEPLKVTEETITPWVEIKAPMLEGWNKMSIDTSVTPAKLIVDKYTNHLDGMINQLKEHMGKNGKVAIKCDHEWKSYVGMTQSYDYCVKCDEKK